MPPTRSTPHRHWAISRLSPRARRAQPVGLHARDCRPTAPTRRRFAMRRKSIRLTWQKVFTSATTSAALVRMNLADTKAQLLQSVNPEKTISARVQASLVIAGGTEPRADPLEPILDAPDFPQPMYEALRDLSQDFLFPGLEQVPPNTVTLLETNPKFVESFLVGLNAEMSRELLWRNYPTDQRGTYFRQFWDTSAGSERTGHRSDQPMGRPQARRECRRGRATGAAPSRRAAAPVPELGDLCRGGGATRRSARAVIGPGRGTPSALSRHAETRRHVSGF